MSKKTIAIVVSAVLLLSLFWTGSTAAQGQEDHWFGPYQLSTDAGKASDASLVADSYGFVHAFWTEILYSNQNTVIEYARFDGGTWSGPNDIYVTMNGIEDFSSTVDRQGILHLVWSEGLYGPVYHTYAPVADAMSAQSWAKPIKIDIPAGILQFRVDSKGAYHIVYIDRVNVLGVYYLRSTDQGETWSAPLWLDPDILPGHTPDSLNFEIDDYDNLHATWFYGALLLGDHPDWVRYIHSLDAGKTWSQPIQIDQFDGATGHLLESPSPRMIIDGKTVHLIWAAGSQPYRFYRYSTDSGRTWSEPKLVFGELQGQAFDTLALDGRGRVHFFGQIRYPIGIYHAYRDQDWWSPPSLVYVIADENGDMGHRIHAHLLQAAVRAGNQIVLTFGDPPSEANRRLFFMYKTLDDVTPQTMLPTPTATATLVLPPTPTSAQTEVTPMATATTAPISTVEALPVGSVPKADRALQFGIIPVLILIGGTFVFRLWYKQKP